MRANLTVKEVDDATSFSVVASRAFSYTLIARVN